MQHEIADRKRSDYGFILVLMCAALRVVNAMFGSSASDIPLVGA
jgi:hypothetical protein